MALVRELRKSEKEPVGIHEEVECTYTVLRAEDGRKVLQLDTYGRPGRKHPDKVSQSIQFDASGVQQLLVVIQREFW